MGDFLRRHVLHNLGLKLISLALAAVMWMAIAHDPVAIVPIEVPIEFRNVPKNLEISTEHIPTAQIRLRGPERLMRGLQPSDVRLEIDLAGTKPGERTFDLTAQQVHQPYNLEVVLVVPSQLHLTFDTELTRQVEIRPRVVGALAPGYSIAQVVVNPPVITVTGPHKRVQAVEDAITDPVDVSGMMDRGTFVTHAYVSDPMVQIVDPAPIRVTVIMQKTAVARHGGH
jgi:YbbR domain-containing protein